MNSAWSSAIIFKRVLTGAVLACVTIMAGCSSYFFYPMKPLVRTPDQIDLNYEDVHVTTADGVNIHGWLLKAPQRKGIVFFLHGNAENISTHIGSVYWLPEKGYDVLMMDYRGYGRSEGKADFPEVFLDVQAMHQWLNQYASDKPVPVYVLGQSLGAAISSYYFGNYLEQHNNQKDQPASERPFDGIVLDSVFAGHQQISKAVLSQHIITWPFQFIVPWFLPSAYNPIDYVTYFSPTPVLFFHSPEDQVLPYSQGKQVYEQAAEPKYWVTTHGPHIATFNFPEYQNRLLEFLENPAGFSATNHAQTDSFSSQSPTSTSGHGQE